MMKNVAKPGSHDLIGTVSKENLWHFTCAFCCGTWSIGTMDDWHPSELFCTHCGRLQTNREVHTEKHFSKTGFHDDVQRAPASEDAPEDTVGDLQSSITIVPKTKERLYAEDRMTHQECGDDGWWNPILKKCVGTGKGHNVIDETD